MRIEGEGGGIGGRALRSSRASTAERYCSGQSRPRPVLPKKQPHVTGVSEASRPPWPGAGALRKGETSLYHRTGAGDERRCARTRRCFFSSLKTLLISTEGKPPVVVNVLSRLRWPILGDPRGRRAIRAPRRAEAMGRTSRMCPAAAVSVRSKTLAESASDGVRWPSLPLGLLRYHASESFSTTSFLASTREQSSQRFLSGSMLSL